MAHNGSEALSSSLNYKDLSYDEAIQVINDFYPSPELPPSQLHTQAPLLTNAEGPEPRIATDDELTTMMSDIEAMGGLESGNHFQLPPEDAPTHLESPEVDRSALNPYTKATPPNTSNGATQSHKFSPPALPMDATDRATPAGAVIERPAPSSSSNRSELQHEMRQEEVDPSSPLRSMPAPVPFSISKAEGINSKRAASSSPLGSRQPPPKKAKRVPSTVSSPLMLFGSLPPSPSPSTHLQSESEDVVQPPNSQPAASLESQAPVARSSPEQNGPQSAKDPASRSIRTDNTSPRSICTAVSAVTGPQRTRSNHSVADEEPAKAGKGAKGKVAPRPKQMSLSNGRSNGARPAKSMSDSTESQTPADTEMPDDVAKPVGRYRPPLGSHELKDLMGADALPALHAGNSPQRLTRHQRSERAASQPGVSTKEAVQRRRQSGKK